MSDAPGRPDPKQFHPSQKKLSEETQTRIMAIRSWKSRRRDRALFVGIVVCSLMVVGIAAAVVLRPREPAVIPEKRAVAPPPEKGKKLEYRSDSVIIRFNEPTQEAKEPGIYVEGVTPGQPYK
jgi:hypothetical protein